MSLAQGSSTILDIWPAFKPLPYETKRVKGHSFKILLADQPNKEIILGYHHSGKTFVRDTLTTDDKGLAIAEGKADWEGGIYLVAIDGVSLFEFVYSATESGFTLEAPNTTDPLPLLQAKGSPENSLFFDYQRERVKRSITAKRLGDRYTANKDAGNKDSLKVIRALSESSAKALTEYQLGLAEKYPESMVALIINLMREPEVPEIPESYLAKPDADSSMWRYLYFKQHFWDYVDFSDDRILRTPILRDRVNKYMGQSLTVQVPDSICASAMGLIDQAREANKEVYKNILTWIMSKYENSNIMGMNAVVCCIGNKYYANDPEVDWMKAKQKEKLLDHLNKECNVLVGNMAHDMVMLDYDGVPRSLYTTKADYTIVYFYSATCGHCKKVTPKVKSIFDDYKGKGVTVFAVNTDQKDIKDADGNVINRVESEDYRKYVKENNLDWINVADPLNQTNFRYYYNIYSTPVIYLVDKEKKFIGVRLDWLTLRKMLLHEVDGMEHEDIDTWLKEHGFEQELEEGDTEEGEETGEGEG
jgi:thiol-disulfide isomerase/thioredoxin